MKKSRQEYEAIRAQERERRKAYDEGDGEAMVPHTVCLSVNSNCFFRCSMCDIGAANAREARGAKGDDDYFARTYRRGGRNRDFPLDAVKRIVDELAPHAPTIKTNFVEPLLYKPLREVAEYVKGKGLKYYTITNGWTLARHAPWLVETGTDLIRISLDGTREVHDAIRGVKGSYDRTIAGIRALINEKRRQGKDVPVLGLCLTISDRNWFNLVDFFEELRGMGLLGDMYVNVNHLQYTTPWEVERTLEEVPEFTHLSQCSVTNIDFADIDIDGLRRQIDAVRERFDPDEFHYYFSPELKGDDLRDFYTPESWMFPRTPCHLPWYVSQVDIDGNLGVYGHCILPSFGNVLEDGFLGAWNSERAKAIRRALRDAGSYPGCNRCIGTLYPLRGRS